MPFAQIHSACVSGAKVVPVTVEVDIRPGLPQFIIIGLPDKRIDEAKERVKSALRNSKYTFPNGRITVNLSPSSVHKSGTGLDLAITLAILQSKQLIRTVPEDIWVIGELSLDGSVQKVSSLLAILVEATRRQIKACLIPHSNHQEALTVIECPVWEISDLKEVSTINFNIAPKKLTPIPPPIEPTVNHEYLFNAIFGQEQAKRALIIALAGGHNLFLTGPPGAGKTMLAQAAIQLLPPLERGEVLELAEIYSLSGETFDCQRLQRPFRSPHHTISIPGMFGGGNIARPGEISLAHRGILFLDEFSELNRQIREALREPMQSQIVRVFRQGQEFTYPAGGQIIAAQNSCPCGLSGVEGERCRCTPTELLRYQKVVSEPILDRFDLFCQMPKIKIKDSWDINTKNQELASIRAAASIQSCWQIQKARLADHLNAQMNNHETKQWADLDTASKQLLERAASSYYISGRGLLKICKVARTIADLDNREDIHLADIQEALQYRRRRHI